jgi:iron complex outermembrane receptor protein
MTRNTEISRAVRRALVWSAVAAASAATIPAQAQEQTEEDTQTVTVTGTRIVRQDYQSASPIVTVGEEAFRQTGSTTVETMLNTLPQFVPSVTNTSNNPSNNGQANVELRGLSPSRTLVLLDGKRVIPGGGEGIVDLNLLPSTLISNVEIITGGASAAYGSDAVAGVVNFKTKEVEGLEFETNYGQTKESDGEEWQASITGGMKFADGRGKLVGTAAYSDRAAVRAGDRDFSRVARGWFGPEDGFLPLGSGTIEEGTVTVNAPQAAVDTVFSSYGFAPGTVGTRVFSVNADNTLFTTGNGTTPSVTNFKGDTASETFNDISYTYNFSPPNYLQLPLERKSAFGRGSFEVTPAAEVYVQGVWSEYDANTQLAPSPGSQMFIPVTNPFLPADLAFLASQRVDDPSTAANETTAPLSLSKRLTELGPRFENNAYEVYQFIGGVTGNVFSEWTYDVYGSYGNLTIDNTQLGSISRTKLEQATFAADGGVALCGGLNPFGLGSISPECAEFVTVDAVNTFDVTQTIFEATISGGLFDLPAGKLQTALGVFYKEDEFAFIADELLRATTVNSPAPVAVRADVSGFNASDNTTGKTDSTEFYTELSIPVLAKRPGVEKLDVNLGYRFADYSTAGGVNSYKGEMTYMPTQQFLARGSYQRAVRAPNIVELFQPQLTNFPSIASIGGDPCNVGSAARTGANAAQVRALCVAQGSPASGIDTYNAPNQQAAGLSGGNPNLFEESADTLTFGLVYTPQVDGFFSNFRASIDWYSIEIEDAIDEISASTFVGRCYDPAFNPEFTVDNVFCGFFGRSTSDGQIQDALELSQNIGALETSGIDVQLDWAGSVGPGRLNVNWVTAYLDKFDRQELPGDPFTELKGTLGETIGTAFPDLKSTLNVAYSIGGVGVSARFRYIDSMTDVGDDTFTIGSETYIDLMGSYAFSEGLFDGLTLRLGITNLSDIDPPNYPSAIQSNTDPSTYDVLGRRFFMSALYKFQ